MGNSKGIVKSSKIWTIDAAKLDSKKESNLFNDYRKHKEVSRVHVEWIWEARYVKI